MWILLFISAAGLAAQDKYWVTFSDKENVKFDPYEYFDARTIEKREKAGIPLVQFTDLPVKKEYSSAIKQYSPVTSVSRWLNAVAVTLSEKQLEEIRNLKFVREVRKMTLFATMASRKGIKMDSVRLDHLKRQTGVMGGELFRENNINGKGVRIAVFDGGFPSVDTLEIFRHIFDENRIIATHDFVNDDDFVYDYNSHGTSVLACIAGIEKGQDFGLATGAEFLLARTEVNIEIFAEEEYWAAAMEWADKNGADIISSSLGYTYHRYFPKQMDGKSVFITRIANLAARKGMLVVNAAGNDGDSDWQVIGAPADADSVLTIGGISSFTGIHIGFSSFGPTFDGRMKPNVVAFGDVITTGKRDLKTAYGTSFSTPLVSGFAACVKQLHPEWSNMKLFEEIQKSGHLYPYYDYAHGYGVPQAAYFYDLKPIKSPTFKFNKKINYLEIEVNKVDSASLAEARELEREGLEYFGSDASYLYFHIASEKTGKIRKYKVINMQEADRFSIDLNDIKKDEYVMASYQGYSDIYKF